MLNSKGKDGSSAIVSWVLDIHTMADKISNYLINPFGTLCIDAVSIENSIAQDTADEDLQNVTNDKWCNFTKTAAKIWKIECPLKLTDEVFEERNRGQQSAATSIMSIIFSKVHVQRVSNFSQAHQ